MDIEDLKQQQFTKLVEREVTPLVLSLIHQGISDKKQFEKTLGYSFSYRNRIDFRRSINHSAEELQQEMNILRRAIAKDAGFIDQYIFSLQQVSEKLLTGLDGIQCQDDFQELSRRVRLLLPVMVYLVSMVHVEKILTDKFMSITESKNIQGNAMQILSKPFRMIPHSESQLALLKLCCLHHKKGNIENIDKEIEEYLYNYGFVSMKWGSGDALCKNMVIKRIQKTRNCNAQLRKWYLKEVKEEQQYAKLQRLFNTEECQQIDFVRKIAYYRTYRGDLVDMWLYKNTSLFGRISGKLGIADEDIKYLTIQEILNREIPESEEIKRRKNYDFALITTPKGSHLSTDDNLLRDLEEFLFERPADEPTVKGIVAGRGYVKGRARIIKSYDDLEKVKRDDILVAPMTTPNWVSAMKRAAAIVTDEGGITCHAAIVAREMNKPCIIATKIATKVFKDGDLVELDAEKGIVRKIKSILTP